METLDGSDDMEGQGGFVLDAITHAVAAERRRREGVEVLADLHREAARDALTQFALAAVAAAGRER